MDELAKLTTGFTFDSDFGRQSDRPIMRGQSTILGDDVYYTGTLLDLDLASVSASRFTDASNQSLRAFFGMNRLPRQIGLSAAVKF